jgi:hypothetical protein
LLASSDIIDRPQHLLEVLQLVPELPFLWFLLRLFHHLLFRLLASQRPLDDTDPIALGADMLLYRLQPLPELPILFTKIRQLARFEKNVSFFHCWRFRQALLQLLDLKSLFWHLRSSKAPFSPSILLLSLFTLLLSSSRVPFNSSTCGTREIISSFLLKNVFVAS